jgi:hypothetical protein
MNAVTPTDRRQHASAPTSLGAALLGVAVLCACDDGTKLRAPSTELVQTSAKVASASPRPRPVARTTLASTQLGPGGQRDLVNPEALIPPQCYTRTEGRHNPCYVCHQNAIEGDGHENRLNDGFLQGEYGFSDFALTNRWANLFVDRSDEVRAQSDDEIVSYVAVDNYTPLVERLARDPAFQGWKPDLEDLQLGAVAFDAHGLAKDGSHWVAFNYMPMPSTFWPTNGATDDVMIRLPPAFRTGAPGGEFQREIYLANLLILETAIKNLDAIDSAPLDELRVGADLNGDGKKTLVRRIRRPAKYLGAASEVEVHSFLYPRGTEFLHTVRYVGADPSGNVFLPPRMKEVRYMVKHTFIPKHALGGLYDNEVQEKIEANPPYFADFRDRGIDNGFGWRLQGFIEDAEGQLRSNTYEETLFCMGCHATVGATIDKVFSFARKVEGSEGFRYIDLRAMKDAPSVGEAEGQILTYLKRSGGGSEFRHNEEMQQRWFRADGSVDEAKVKAATSVYSLVTPSRRRALELNKAYRVIVKEQGFLLGRDPSLTPPKNVFASIDKEVPPLEEEFRFKWDIRVAW